MDVIFENYAQVCTPAQVLRKYASFSHSWASSWTRCRRYEGVHLQLWIALTDRTGEEFHPPMVVSGSGEEFRPSMVVYGIGDEFRLSMIVYGLALAREILSVALLSGAPSFASPCHIASLAKDVLQQVRMSFGLRTSLGLFVHARSLLTQTLSGTSALVLPTFRTRSLGRTCW